MSFDTEGESFDTAHGEHAYCGRRVRKEAAGAATADPLTSTLTHVALPTAYAEGCRNVGDRAWINEHRVW